MNIEEKVDSILEAMSYQLPEVKKAAKDFSESYQRLRTFIRNIKDKPKSKQLEKQLEKILDQMLELLGSLYKEAARGMK